MFLLLNIFSFISSDNYSLNNKVILITFGGKMIVKEESDAEDTKLPNRAKHCYSK